MEQTIQDTITGHHNKRPTLTVAVMRDELSRMPPSAPVGFGVRPPEFYLMLPSRISRCRPECANAIAVAWGRSTAEALLSVLEPVAKTHPGAAVILGTRDTEARVEAQVHVRDWKGYADSLSSFPLSASRTVSEIERTLEGRGEPMVLDLWQAGGDEDDAAVEGVSIRMRDFSFAREGDTTVTI